MRTVKNLLQHELIGLDCEVVSAANKASVGINGKIIDETMKTIVIQDGKENKIVFKKGSMFHFTVGGKKVIINGDHLVARSEDRIKKKIRKW